MDLPFSHPQTRFYKLFISGGHHHTSSILTWKLKSHIDSYLFLISHIPSVGTLPPKWLLSLSLLTLLFLLITLFTNSYPGSCLKTTLFFLLCIEWRPRLLSLSSVKVQPTSLLSSIFCISTRTYLPHKHIYFVLQPHRISHCSQAYQAHFDFRPFHTLLYFS